MTVEKLNYFVQEESLSVSSIHQKKFFMEETRNSVMPRVSGLKNKAN